MKLIEKSALVAEIERRRDKYINLFLADEVHALSDILEYIDTLETKRVDLEKEYKDFVEEDPVYNKLVNSIVGKAIAKHFFELGLKTKGE